MKTILWTLASAAALILNGCGGTTETSDTAEYVPFDAPAIDAAQKQNFLDAINEARATGRQCGDEGWFDAAQPVKWDNGLYKAAYEHTRDMSLSGHYEHSGSGGEYDWTATVLKLGRGSTYEERSLNNSGHGGFENIAAYYVDLKDVMTAWIESPGHCANIMYKDHTVVGMALYDRDGKSWDYNGTALNDGYYWAQVFY